ncbi:MAG: hypothetical protein ACRD5K_16290 [Candidatus Acidiferrales bacterium]
MIDWHVIVYVMRHDPLPVLGFLFLGASAVLFFHIQSAMAKAGHKVHFQGFILDIGLPGEYLKTRTRHGWAAWPAYVVWPCLILGILLLIGGLALER